MNISDRILAFYNFLFQHGFDGGICIVDSKFHVNVNLGTGKVVSHNEAKTLTEALDLCIQDIRKAGL